jgi:hypothetical protein
VGGKLGMAITNAIADCEQELGRVAADLAGFTQPSPPRARPWSGRDAHFALRIIMSAVSADFLESMHEPARASPHHIFSISGYG